jgi:hypothetical protein
LRFHPKHELFLWNTNVHGAGIEIDHLLFYVPLKAFEQGGIFILPHLL